MDKALYMKSTSGNDGTYTLTVSFALGTDADARMREQVIWINALLFIWPRMRNAPGRSTPPKPTSALAVLKGIRRMHAKLGYETVPLTQVVRAMLRKIPLCQDAQVEYVLQTSCLGTSKINHLLRANGAELEEDEG